MVVHPGTLLSEKLKDLKMEPQDFAHRTGLSESKILELIKGKQKVTPDIAIRFQNAIQVPANFWLKSQRLFDQFNPSY